MPPVCVGGGAWRVAQAARSNSDKQEAGLMSPLAAAPLFIQARLISATFYLWNLNKSLLYPKYFLSREMDTIVLPL